MTRQVKHKRRIGRGPNKGRLYAAGSKNFFIKIPSDEEGRKKLADIIKKQYLPDPSINSRHKDWYKSKDVIKMIQDCIEIIKKDSYHNDYDALIKYVEFLASMFSLIDKKEVKLSPETFHQLLIKTDFNLMRRHKWDYFGELYESLVGKHDQSARGFFRTPFHLVDMMVQIIKPDGSLNEPAMGTGTMILRAIDFMKPGHHIFGTELNTNTYHIALINMLIYCPPSNPFFLFRGNALTEPELYKNLSKANKW